MPARLAFSIISAYCWGDRAGPTTFCGLVNVVAAGGLNVNLPPLTPLDWTPTTLGDDAVAVGDDTAAVEMALLLPVDFRNNEVPPVTDDDGTGVDGADDGGVVPLVGRMAGPILTTVGDPRDHKCIIVGGLFVVVVDDVAIDDDGAVGVVMGANSTEGIISGSDDGWVVRLMGLGSVSVTDGDINDDIPPLPSLGLTDVALDIVVGDTNVTLADDTSGVCSWWMMTDDGEASMWVYGGNDMLASVGDLPLGIGLLSCLSQLIHTNLLTTTKLSWAIGIEQHETSSKTHAPSTKVDWSLIEQKKNDQWKGTWSGWTAIQQCDI
jgi:hypothetical protein